MHQHAITNEQFVAIDNELEVFGRVNEGRVLTTIGKHPVFGACILLKNLESEPILLSQSPFEAVRKSTKSLKILSL